MKDFDLSELNQAEEKAEYKVEPLRALFLLCKDHVSAARDATARYAKKDLKEVVAENILKRKPQPVRQGDYWAYLMPPTFEVHDAALKLFKVCQDAGMPDEAITSAARIEDVVSLFKEPPLPSRSGTSYDIDNMVDGLYVSRGHGK